MQERRATLAADARVAALSGPAVTLAVGLGVALTALFTLAILTTAFYLTSDTGVRALSMDFRVFWAAAQLALGGEPLAAFDMARLGAVHNVNAGDWMPWLYPPGYLLLISPLGALSFSWAYLLATLLAVALIGLAVRPFTAGSRLAWLAMLLAPAYLPALAIGQNSLLWLAGLLAALAALRGERWVLAGFWIGCLTLKPQLGLMIPVALVAAGCWRTILSASATAIVLAALPTLVVGPDYWPLLLSRLGEQADHLMATIDTLHLMVGPFFLATLLGLSPDQAFTLQLAIMAGTAVLLFALWRAPQADFDSKAGGLLLAVLLSAPYFWYYEGAILAAVGLFFLRAGILRRTPLHLILLLLLWMGAGLQLVNVFADFADQRLLGAVTITPLMAASLALLLRHHILHHRTPLPAS